MTCPLCHHPAGERGLCDAHTAMFNAWGLTLCPFTGRVLQAPTFAELVAEPLRLYEWAETPFMIEEAVA